MNLHWLLISSLLFSTTALLAENAAPMLVDVNWLASHLKDRDLVLLHVGPKDAYATSHIPGARFIALEDVALPMKHTDPMEMMLELPSPEVLRAKFESFGISSDSRIVVYFSVRQAFQSSTRVVFTLDYLGLGERTSLLNGGLPAWTAAGKPTTAEAAANVIPGKITPRPARDIVADATLVQAVSKHPDEKLIDARAPVFYNGTEATYNKNGHIPGAVNLPFSELLDDSLMIDKNRVGKLFADAGVKPGDKVVAYCHIGQRATTVVFTARLLGHHAMLYDGSFQDWAIHSRGPVEK